MIVRNGTQSAGSSDKRGIVRYGEGDGGMRVCTLGCKAGGWVPASSCRHEFGFAPSGSWWRVDHPRSAVLQLADGVWHNVLIYQIVDNLEIEGAAAMAPQTGHYVEEVFSRGEAIQAWRF